MLDKGDVMNPYLQHLTKMEFIVTYACTGRCKHCSEGDHTTCGEVIDPRIAAEAVRQVGGLYDLRTVMAFGGEPLLHPDVVCAIMTAAKELHIPKRQVITNGYFSKDPAVIRRVAEDLSACGVNDLLLSVDAFHQETIPLDTVRVFAVAAKEMGIPLCLSPAWLVSPSHDNGYNRQTREILDRLTDLNLPVGEGNVVFPEGNARRYLAEYFISGTLDNPYVENPTDVRCLSFSPDGRVLDGNIYKRDILDILKDYTP